MDSYNYHTPSQKLKDSCDPCSSSKLRCGKQKPTCARCAALNQQCSYSPARRSGRPHRVRRSVSQQCPVVPAESSGNLIEPAGYFDQKNEFGLHNSSILASQTERNQQQYHQQQYHQQHHHHQQHQQQTADTPLHRDASAESGGGDCTGTAIFVMEQLDTARMRSDPTYSSLTIIDSCQRLLKILICPCSEQPGVALLVASGCMSLMDAVNQLACYHLPRDTTTPDSSASTSTSPGTDKSLSVGLMQSSPRNALINSSGSSSSSSSRSGNSQGGMEDLAKIAKVILQFTDRYHHQDPQAGTGWARTIRLVAPMVTLLRSRLQSVTHEAARRMVL
ncbi:hypothetical protein QQS21_000643 [Conoideocrella luteorostrata]|uniref:Zn(2)-C6 fungal-type domain-containing protein n=1 Tax=Conoideocrella luteorostrata TaxID=1105319 RepID=A0AAJ0G2E4_9HYPO|nr:hypothetical protein QQS21_000643 [Conoideocrella luteorostrata]